MIGVIFSLLLVVSTSLFCMDKTPYVNGMPTIFINTPEKLETYGFYRGTPGTPENHYFTPGQEDEVLFKKARLAEDISDDTLFGIRFSGISEEQVREVKKFEGMRTDVESYEAALTNGDTVWCFHWADIKQTTAIRKFNSAEIATKLPIDRAITLQVLRKIYQNTQK